MNLIVTKDQLINGLQAVQNVVSTRTTLPILSNVLLRADGKRLELTATDLDVTVSCGVDATVIKPGATTLPAKTLFGIVRELAVGDVAETPHPPDRFSAEELWTGVTFQNTAVLELEGIEAGGRGLGIQFRHLGGKAGGIGRRRYAEWRRGQ